MSFAMSFRKIREQSMGRQVCLTMPSPDAFLKTGLLKKRPRFIWPGSLELSEYYLDFSQFVLE